MYGRTVTGVGGAGGLFTMVGFNVGWTVLAVLTAAVVLGAVFRMVPRTEA